MLQGPYTMITHIIVGGNAPKQATLKCSIRLFNMPNRINSKFHGI